MKSKPYLFEKELKGFEDITKVIVCCSRDRLIILKPDLM